MSPHGRAMWRFALALGSAATAAASLETGTALLAVVVLYSCLLPLDIRFSEKPGGEMNSDSGVAGKIAAGVMGIKQNLYCIPIVTFSIKQLFALGPS